MIKYIFILSTLLFTFVAHGQLNSSNRSVSQNTTFESGLSVEGRFDVTTTTIGSQPCPIMTSTQRDAIGSPATGDCVFNSTDAQYEFYSGSQWDSLGGAGTSATIDNILIKYNSSTGETVNSNIYSVGSLVGINQASSFGDLAVYDSGTDSVITLNNSVSGSTSSDGLVISQESNAASIQNKEADSLILGTNASDVLEIESDGTISAVSATYESLVTADDDIPNKKYVDDGITTSAATKQDLDGDLTAISALSSSGILARTGSETYSARTIQGTTDEITVTNGNGAGGDPTIGIANNPVLGGNEGVTIPNGTTAQRPGSPNTGELRWNTTDTAAEIYDGTDWTAVGGGLGSAQTISIVQADDDSTDISGNNATFDGGGTTSGSITQNTTASNFLTGEKKVYFYDASATPQNDYFGWTRNIPQGWRGRTIAYEFTYRTDAVYQNGDIVWQIKDNTNGDLLIINGLPLDQASNANGNGQTIRGLVNIPEDAASLDFGFQVVGTTASFDFFVDKISLDIDDFNYKNVSSTQSFRFSGAASGMTSATAGTQLRWGTLTGSGDTNLLSYDDSNGRFTALTNCVVDIVAIAILTGASNMFIFFNGTDGYNGSGAVALGHISGTLNLTAGDFFSIGSNANLNTTQQARLEVVATATSKHVVVDSDVQHGLWQDYNPTLVGVGTTTNQDIKWRRLGDTIEIQGRWTNGTTTATEFQLPLPTGYTVSGGYSFTQVVGEYERGAATVTSFVALATAGDSFLNVGYRTASINAIATPQNANTVFGTGDAMYINAKVKIAELENKGIGEYHLVPVTDQENVFSARVIDGSGTTTIESENQDWIDGVCTNPSAGNYTCNFTSGIFTQKPSCVVTPEINNIAQFTAHTKAISSSAISILIGFDNGTDLDADFSIVCQKQGADYKEPKAFIGAVVFPQTCYLRDVKATATDAGTSTSNTLHTRTLNTKDGDCSWVTLGNGTTGTGGTANQFTLSSGKYEIEASAPSMDAGATKIYLYNVSDSSLTISGKSGWRTVGEDTHHYSTLQGNAEITSSKTFEIKHWISAGKPTNGLGYSGGATNASDIEVNEIYTEVKITKVK